MRRLTTPTQVFTIPLDISEISVLQITYKQGNKIVMTKHLSGIAAEGKQLYVRLTQEETKAFAVGAAAAQIRFLTTAGDAFSSAPIVFNIEASFDEKVLR